MPPREARRRVGRGGPCGGPNVKLRRRRGVGGGRMGPRGRRRLVGRGGRVVRCPAAARGSPPPGPPPPPPRRDGPVLPGSPARPAAARRRFRPLTARPLTARPLTAALLAGAFVFGPSGIGPGVWGPAAASAGPPAQDFELAAGLYKKGRYEDAARRFGDFLAEHPGHEYAKRAALFRGFSLYEAGELAAARDALRAALAQDGDADYAPSALLRIGLAETALGNGKAAAEALETLRADYPADPLADAALLPLAKARQAAGDLPGAARAARQYLNVTAKDPDANPATRTDARRTLGNVLAEQGETDEAAAELRRAADDARPKADEALRDLGLLEYRRGNHRTAADAFAELIAREPARGLLADARINRGFALYRLEENDAAATELRAAADLAGPELAQQARLWAGRAAQKAGDPEAAASDFRIARELAPDGRWAPDVLYRWGILLADSPEPADRTAALQKFDRILADFPDSNLVKDAAQEAARLLLARAKAAVIAGDSAAAREAATRALQYDPAAPDAPRTAFLLARVDEAELPGAADAPARRAVEATYAALAANPQAPADVRRDAALRRAASLRDRGAYAEALDGFRQVAEELKAGEDDAALRDALAFGAATAAAAGDPEAAATLGGRFLEAFPDAPRAAVVRATLAEAAAAAGDFDAALAGYEAATRSGRTAGTDRLALRLADRAIDRLEALPADAADRARQVDSLAATAADLAGPVAADEETEDADLRAEALTLLGWANFHRDRFADAAAAFRTVVEELPGTRTFDEALIQSGVSLARGGEPEAAAVALRTAWRRLAPAEPAPAGADVSGPLQGAWIAGLERAKLLRDLAKRDPSRADDAGAAFAELYEKFPQSRPGPLLADWGAMWFEAKRHDEADAVYAMLVERAPENREADRALLILAESDLLAKPSRPADAAAKLARLLDPAEGEPIVTDDVTARDAVEWYLTALAKTGDADAVVAAAGPLAERFPGTRAAAVARLLAAEARVELAAQDLAAAAPDRAAALRAAARDDLADARATLAGLDVATDAADRPTWAARAWILGADLAYRAKDYSQVDRLAEELGRWNPPPRDLFEMREIQARRFKQQAPPDFDRAEELAAAVVNDPAAKGKSAWDRAQILLADVALLRPAPAEAQKTALLTKARDIYLNLNVLGSNSAVKALGGLKTGEMEERLGNPAAARREYQEVIADFPDAPEAAAAADRLKALDAG